MDSKIKVTAQTRLVNIFLVTVISCYLFTLLEWLFFITKPSFLSNWTLFESTGLLLLVPLPAVAAAFVLFFIFRASFLLVPDPKISRFIPIVYVAIPSLVLAAAAFLLLENFTYTLFGFNVGSFKGITRYVYPLAIILFALWVGRKLYELAGQPVWEAIGRHIKSAVMVMLLIAMALGALRFAQMETVRWDDIKDADQELLNVLILSTDGLNASHMSAYGYHRDTTPFIQSLVPQSLIVENHFTNNAKSTGSIGALFSGKFPTNTRVIYPPDIFHGIDAYQHMPGMLKKLGYLNADFSIRHYTDPYDLNMREGFDLANGREFGEISNSIKLPGFVKNAFMKESYFLEVIFSRLLVRVQHALSINDMVNPYLLVTDLEDAQRHFPDSKRIDQLFDFIDSSSGPFFAHVHLMVTHGTKFSLQHQVFSLGKEQQDEWMTDFYDDSILNYDLIVQRVVNHLKENNLFEKTLLILTSDHGAKWMANERIPLILRFPNQQYAGVRHNNVQRIDVTASIIEYLGLKKPGWIEGESFLNGEFEPDRPIFYADSIAMGTQNSAGWRDVSSYEAPYYSLGGVGVIVAQSWHYWDLSNNRMSSGKIKNHTAPLADKELPTRDEARDQIATHLQKYTYPVPEYNK